jgi:DNA-binding CsgD family transcriptional regulator
MKIQQQIAALSAEGLNQTQICERLGLTRGRVQWYRRKLKLTASAPGPRVSPIPEAAALRYLRRGISRRVIAERLGVSASSIRTLAQRHGIGRPVLISPEIHKRLAEAVRRRAGFAVELAQQFHAPYKTVLKMAKRIHGADKFFCSRTVDGPFQTRFAATGPNSPGAVKIARFHRGPFSS